MTFAGEGIVVWVIRVMVFVVFCVEMWWLWRSRQGHRPFNYEIQGLDAEAARLMDGKDWILIGYSATSDKQLDNDVHLAMLNFQDRESFEAQHKR